MDIEMKFDIKKADNGDIFMCIKSGNMKGWYKLVPYEETEIEETEIEEILASEASN